MSGVSTEVGVKEDVGVSEGVIVGEGVVVGDGDTGQEVIHWICECGFKATYYPNEKTEHIAECICGNAYLLSKRAGWYIQYKLPDEVV